MKKNVKIMIALVLAAAVLGGCAGAASEESAAETIDSAEEKESEGEAEAEEELSGLQEGLPEDLLEGGLPEDGVLLMEPGEMAEVNGESEGNVAYAGVSETQVCDIYKPEGEGPFPVIVLVHGGGFMFGDQRMELILPVIETGVDRGYAVVSVDYRKSAEAVFPAALADVKAAVRFVRANAETYGFDTEHIAVWGESAGAYLSLMTALTPEVEALNGDVAENMENSSSVDVLVDFYGPVEFYTMDDEYAALGKTDSTFSTNESFESMFVGQAIGDDREVTYQTYWETYLEQLPDDYSLKAWIQVGDSDESVPYTQSENFAERLANVIGENNVEFSIIEGAGHEDPLFYTDENLDKVFTFLDGIMK